MAGLLTPWKINMEPTNHPLRKENDLSNLLGIMFHVNLQGCSGTCTRPFNMWTWSFFPLDLREVWREATPGSEYTYPTEQESRKIIDSKVPLKGVMLAPRRVLVSLNQLTITKQSYFAIGETFPVSRDSHVTKNEHNYVAIFRSI